MNAAPHHSDAIAAAAFARYAEASTRFQQTHRPADAAAARRAYRGFVEAFLSPAEQAGLEAAGVPGLGRRA